MKRFLSAVVVFVVLLLILGTGCTDKKKNKSEVIRPVRYQRVISSDGIRTRVFSGTAKSALESNLSFRVGGSVSQIKVKVGDVVQKGQLIATLDAKDYSLQVQEAEAGFQQAKAQALNASSNYGRIRKLYENDNVSKSDLDNSRAAYESAKALVRSIEKKLELAKSRKNYTVLSAPFTGAVSTVFVDENENIATGQPVVALSSEATPEVLVAIPEVLISSIREGRRVRVRFDAIPGVDFKGVVTEVGVASTRFATTYPVTVVINRKDSGVKPGMVANVAFVFDSNRKSAIFVPSHCVGEEKKQRFVFIAKPGADKTAIVKRLVVDTGELVSEGLEIRKGLSENDLVITAGISRLEDGMTVRLLDHTPFEEASL